MSPDRFRFGIVIVFRIERIERSELLCRFDMHLFDFQLLRHATHRELEDAAQPLPQRPRMTIIVLWGSLPKVRKDGSVRWPFTGRIRPFDGGRGSD